MRCALATLVLALTLGSGLRAATPGSVKVDLVDQATGAVPGTLQVQVQTSGFTWKVRMKEGLPDTQYLAGGVWVFKDPLKIALPTILIPVTSDSKGRFKLVVPFDSGEFTPEEVAEMDHVRVVVETADFSQILRATAVFP